MTKTRIDVQGLYAALDAERSARGLSWRQPSNSWSTSTLLLALRPNPISSHSWHHSSERGRISTSGISPTSKTSSGQQFDTCRRHDRDLE